MYNNIVDVQERTCASENIECRYCEMFRRFVFYTRPLRDERARVISVPLQMHSDLNRSIGQCVTDDSARILFQVSTGLGDKDAFWLLRRFRGSY